jgi:hypothetical protein
MQQVQTPRVLNKNCSPERTDDAYWSDFGYDWLTAIIDMDLAPSFEHVRLGGTIVCPAAGLGTGASELPTRAPRIFAYMRQQIIEMKRLAASA